MPRDLAEVSRAYRHLMGTRHRVAWAELGRHDLFFLLVCLLGRDDLRSQWHLDRCDEVQKEPDGFIDLWAREFGKSSIITLGRTIQDILNSPEITIGIFSHTRPIAKAFLKVIKREFEHNELLKRTYPDVLYEAPDKEAPSWSEDGGIVVKRRGNPKESTVEAWGLVDGQPIGRHFDLLVYDDIVTRENAASPEMRAKTLEMVRLSYALGTRGGQRRFIGTRYHFSDAYADIMAAGTAQARVYPAIIDGEPVFMTEEELAEKRRDMGSVVYAAQMMLDPRPADGSGFTAEQLRFYTGAPRGNRFVVVDPANSKTKKSDYTAAWVICCGEDGNYYAEHLVRDRLNLEERVKLVFWLHRTYAPLRVGYERYGMQTDAESMRTEMERQNYRFEIVDLGGSVAKHDRIAGLMPVVERGQLYLPQSLWVTTKDQPERHDIIQEFVKDEFLAWPYGSHDDMLDSLARILDPKLGVVWPRPSERPMPGYGMRLGSRADATAGY